MSGPQENEHDAGLEGKVLLVDDEPIVAKSVTAVLGKSHLHVDLNTAANAKEALDRLRHEHFDLILMDVALPDMDGWDVIREMVEQNLLSGAVISMLTGRYEPDPRLEDVKQYVLNYLRKPFTSVELISVVEAGLLMAEYQRKATT